MMELDVQAAVYQLLVASPSITELGGVYDHVPQVQNEGVDTLLPYFVVGDDTATGADLDDRNGFEVVLTIHSWAESEGRHIVKQMQAAIYAVFQRTTLVVSGYTVEKVNFIQSQSFDDFDGQTRHGISTMRLLLWQII